MPRFDPPSAFRLAVGKLGTRPLLACHNDADGLSAGVILMKALRWLDVEPVIRIVGKGENAYSGAFAGEVRERHAAGAITGLILADLGLSSALSVGDLPTIIVDHHVPTGLPDGATLISGIDDVPVPTTSLLAYRIAAAMGPAEPLLWLAAIGMIGDMAEKDGFPEMEAARSIGITALRKATALINAPRRSSTGDAAPAFALLAKASGPKDVLSGEWPETALLLSARDEVRQEIDKARKAAPEIIGPVALIRIDSPCQVHPLIAQTWSGRLKVPIVMAANSGYRPGWVHFAARTNADVDIPAFLATVRPPGADEQYGKGHRAASGGALRDEDWALFLNALGFQPDRDDKSRTMER